MKLSDLFKMSAGSPLFRIKASPKATGKTYIVYAQSHLEADLVSKQTVDEEEKTITTTDAVECTHLGDIVISLVSGKATIIQAPHVGYLLSHNYVVLKPKKMIAPQYAVYLLNEDRSIKKQLQLGVQGSSVLKYTIRQLRELKVDALPSMHKQELIGKIYFNELELYTLRVEKAELARTFSMGLLQHHLK